MVSKHFLFSPRKLGKWSNLTHIFQMGLVKNHQLEKNVADVREKHHTWMVLAFGWKSPATLSVKHPNVSIGGRLRKIVWASFLMNNRHPTCLEIWKMDAWEKEDSFLLAGWNGSHFCDPMEPRCLRKVSFRSPSSQPENNSNGSGLEKKHVMFILEMLASFLVKPLCFWPKRTSF